MADHRQEIAELLERSRQGSDYSDTALEYCQEAVRVADKSRDIDLGFEARLELIEVACFAGKPIEMLAAFAWCLAQLDKHPSRFDEHTLLWTYKWAIEEAVEFPNITRQQIEEMVADLTERYGRAGAGTRSSHHLRCKIATILGEPEMALRHEKLWQRAPRDWLSDCAACDADTHAQVLFWLDERDRAYEVAKPIFEGRLHCAEVPHRTHARMLLPLFLDGKVDAAMRHHRVGYRMIQEGRKLSARLADHVLFLSVTSNYERALQLVARHLPHTRTHGSPYETFTFEYVALFLLDELLSKGRSEEVIDLSAPYGGAAAGAPRSVASLAVELRKRCTETALLFEERNGNGWLKQWMEAIHGLHEKVIDMPFPEDAP